MPKDPPSSTTPPSLLAERMNALAEEQGIPLNQEPALTRTLIGLSLSSSLPKELSLALAKIIVFTYQVSGKNTPS